ncbi:MAG: HDOD domain-containing protein [Verrucomicrobiota bacterium]
MKSKPKKIKQEVIELLGSYIPSLPRVATELQRIISEEDFSYTKVEDLIMQDTALAAKILKIANSPVYGLSREVESISQAMMIMGMHEIKEIVMGTACVDAFKKFNMKHFDINKFCKHALACAVSARYLASNMGINPLEGYFVAGLIHDLGQIIMAKAFPEAYVKSLDLAVSKNLTTSNAEQEIFKFDHTIIAQAVLEHWKMPKALQAVARYHHNPGMADQFQQEVSIIHLSDAIVEAIGYSSGGESYIKIECTRVTEALISHPSIENLFEEIDFLMETSSSSYE